MTRIAVVVPTYRRPELLAQCLAALEQQTRRPDATIVARRPSDDETADVVAARPGVHEVLVHEDGVVAAMLAGANAASTDVVAFVDDDARPHTTWLERLGRHFDDPRVGGAGGRDIVDRPAQTGALTERVGRVSRWGRVTGNHHLGTGEACPVDVLKGVNMAFRRQALTLPTGLRGRGAQVDYEIATCLEASARGWRLIFDPAALVDHSVGPRFDADLRGEPAPIAIADAAYNRLSIMLSMDRGLGLRRALYGYLVGEGRTPGLLRVILAVTRREPQVLARWKPTAAGQWSALRDFRRGTRIRCVPIDDSRHART